VRLHALKELAGLRCPLVGASELALGAFYDACVWLAFKDEQPRPHRVLVQVPARLDVGDQHLLQDIQHKAHVSRRCLCALQQTNAGLQL